MHLVHVVRRDPLLHFATCRELICSPAFLQLNLSLLVQLHQLAYRENSSTDSRGPPTSSSSSTIHRTAGQQQEQAEEQECSDPSFAAAAQQLLAAAGLPADAAALWLAATRALAASETFLQSTFKAIGMSLAGNGRLQLTGWVCILKALHSLPACMHACMHTLRACGAATGLQ
jgi:hypothetical protein